jgi:hypothetical protein
VKIAFSEKNIWILPRSFHLHCLFVQGHAVTQIPFLF